MPSKVTEPLYNGEPMTFPEFAQRAARVVSPLNIYERDAPIDAPLPDTLGPLDESYNGKRFRDTAVELAEVAGWSAEVAEAEAHTINLSRLKSHLQIVQDRRRKLKGFDFMSAQVAAWIAPTDEHEGMRTVMQNQLDETFKFTREDVFRKPPEKMTGEELREMRLRELSSTVIETNARLELDAARSAEDADFVRAYKESLEGWEPVDVQRRVLP